MNRLSIPLAHMLVVLLEIARSEALVLSENCEAFACAGWAVAHEGAVVAL